MRSAATRRAYFLTSSAANDAVYGTPTPVSSVLPPSTVT